MDITNFGWLADLLWSTIWAVAVSPRQTISILLQWLTVAAWKIPTMVKWSSLIPHLGQQPTTLVIWDTTSAMETAVELVRLMENGLKVHLLVNVSG